MIFCRGGYGVHSPFVFDLLTTVIEENGCYYCYEDLNTVRRQLLQNRGDIGYNNRKYTVKEYLKRFCFSEREDRLLFRLANRFKPRTIYTIGSDLGLAPLYLTAYFKTAHCVVIEPEADAAAFARNYAGKYSRSKIDISGSFDIPEEGAIDFFVWGRSLVTERVTRNNFSYRAFEKILPYMNDKSVMVISDINSLKENRNAWKKVCAHPKVTVTLDLCSLGIVLFSPELNRKTYKSCVL
jgi:hypothetical protein